jgi:hypothetical protein
MPNLCMCMYAGGLGWGLPTYVCVYVCRRAGYGRVGMYVCMYGLCIYVCMYGLEIGGRAGG